MDEELRKEVNRLIEEKMEEDPDAAKEEVQEEILQELDKKAEKEQENILDRLKQGEVSRRDFLKLLGLGGGGLALSSAVSGFMPPWKPPSMGTSSLDADTVDGKHASDLGGSTLVADRDKSGNVKMKSAGNTNTLISSTTVSYLTINTTDAGRFSSFSASINYVDGVMTLYEGGSQLTAQNFSGGGAVSTSNTFTNYHTPTWTAKFSVTNAAGTTNTFLNGPWSENNGGSFSETAFYSVNTHGSDATHLTMKMYARAGNGTFYLSYNGNQMAATTSTNDYTFSASTNVTQLSALTWRVHQATDYTTVQFNDAAATWSYPQTATASATAYINQKTTYT